MNATEALMLLWFAVSVGCIVLAWIKGGWIAGMVVFFAALGVGYLMGVIA